MKNILIKLAYVGLLASILSSCQSKKEEKQININNYSENISGNLYLGKWVSINKDNNKYYYCTDNDRFFEINKNKIYDHTPMEDSNFTIDHTETIGNKTYLYFDKQKSNYYILNWIDKNNGIISFQFNNYEPSLFISEKNIKNIDNKTCESNDKTCEFNNISNNYKYVVEAAEFTNEKENKYPTSAWITITNKKNNKIQDIHYEPNSWAIYRDLPCNDFIIKDYNFDGLEDFAFVWDSGGNGGKLYEYYLQDINGNFSLNDTFPLQHSVLPIEIDNKNKIITTSNPVGCCNINIKTYKLNNYGNWETTSFQKKLK